MSCSWPNPGVLRLLPRFRALPCSCSSRALAPLLLLSSTCLSPSLAPALLLLPPCSCPAYVRALLLPSSCPALSTSPTPALLLPTCYYPAPALLLPYRASALPGPAPGPTLLIPCSCSCPPQFGSLHHHQDLMTFFGTARAAFYANRKYRKGSL